VSNLLADQLYTIYITALYFSIVISIALTGYLWSRRSVKAVLPIIGILMAILFWSVGYLLEYTSNDLSVKLFTYNIQYLGIAFIPVMFLLFALKYTRRDNWINGRRLLLISIIPIITILMVWTKDLHTLMYSNVSLAFEDSFTFVRADYGPWFWVFATYDYLLVMISVILLIIKLFSYPRLYLYQIISIIIIIGAPLSASCLYVFRALPVLPYVDWSAPAFSISAIGMTYLIFRQRLLDVLPVARDSAIEMLSDGYVVLDEHGYILDINPAMQIIIGLPAAEIIGKQLPDIILKQLNQDNGQIVKNEISLAVKGELKYYRVHASPFKKSPDKNEGCILLFYDITESKQFEQKLTAMATHDYLTGLPNRVLLADRFEVALARAKRNRNKFAVMICDLDEFKNVNDTLGHITADKVLKSIATRLNKIMRGGDTLARTGGDEFVIVLSEISKEEEIATVARRIIRAFKKPFIVDTHEIFMSFSIGISIYPDNGRKMWSLINKADSAMYCVKNEGGASYKICDGDEKNS
jgi:diguanylate cyclase (GGDEF)-like protein/PAS domain S-box-containing protein